MKQLDNLPPSDVDDDNDFDAIGHDPFRERWYHRVFGNVFWFIDALRFWLAWPFVSMAHALGFVFAAIGFRFAQLGDRLAFWWHRFSFHVIEFLQIEGMRKSVHDLQHRAAESVEGIRHRVEDTTVRSSWWRNAAERLHRARIEVATRWYGLLDRASQSPILNVFTIPARWLTWLGFAISDFAAGWLWTRNYKHLLFGIPAMLMMLPLGYCAVRLPFHSAEAKIKHYRRAADQAIRNEDLVSANLYFRKLRQLGGEHDRMILQTALLSEEEGDMAAAYEQMQRIAPLAEPGLFEAHVWIAQRISQQELPLPAGSRPRALIETHLRHVVALAPEPAGFQFWLAEIVAGTRSGEAIELLGEINPKQLDWPTRAMMADLYLRLGRAKEARDIAVPVARHFDANFRDVGQLAAGDFLSWAAATEIAGDMGRAIDVLVLGMEQHPENQSLRSTIQKVGLAYYDEIQPTTSARLERKLSVLNLLRNVSDDPVPVLERAVRLLSLPGAKETATAILKRHRQEKGALPPRVLRLLGDMLLAKNKTEDAIRYYDAAFKADPQLHAAANNLAVLKSDSAPPELDVALDLANKAVGLAPDNPHYLETRGQILIKLERWAEAIEDLHRALNGMPRSGKIHRSLATAYEATGQQEQARLHQQQARFLLP